MLQSYTEYVKRSSRVSMSLDDFADAMQKAGYKLPEMVKLLRKGLLRFSYIPRIRP